MSDRLVSSRRRPGSSFLTGAIVALALIAAATVARGAESGSMQTAVSVLGTPLRVPLVPAVSVHTTRLPPGYGISVIDGSIVAVPAATSPGPRSGLTVTGDTAPPMPPATTVRTSRNLTVTGAPLPTPSIRAEPTTVSPNATVVHP
jgi:hypothetical protein